MGVLCVWKMDSLQVDLDNVKGYHNPPITKMLEHLNANKNRTQ